MGLAMENKQDVTKKVNTTIHFDLFQTYRTPSLEEYLSGGMELAFSMAIEMPGHSRSMFTTNDSKLKALKQARDLYMDAIQKVGDTMMHFDNDGHFPVFGFQGDCYTFHAHMLSPLLLPPHSPCPPHPSFNLLFITLPNRYTFYEHTPSPSLIIPHPSPFSPSSLLPLLSLYLRLSR